MDDDDGNWTAPCLDAYAESSDAGIGFAEEEVHCGGSKNGSAPVGEAWFVEGRIRWGVLVRRRRV